MTKINHVINSVWHSLIELELHLGNYQALSRSAQTGSRNENTRRLKPSKGRSKHSLSVLYLINQ